MQVRQLLKRYNNIDSRIAVNNSLILGWKETAMMFLGDSDIDKENREICIAEAKKIKAESDQLLNDRQELTDAIQKLSPVHHQILEMYYINGFETFVCCDILNISKYQFYSLKEKAVQELERMIENAQSNL